MSKDVEEIKRIVAPIAETHGVTKLYLFGSRAKGTETADSDYDFVISKGDISIKPPILHSCKRNKR